MIRVWLPLLIFFFFVFDGTVMQVFSAHWFGTPYVFVPRFTMVLILFIAVFLKRSTALLYGLIFGLMTDIVYSDIIGVYFFSMAFTGYMIGSFAPLFRKGWASILSLGLLGIVLLEFQVYGLYTIIGIADVPLHPFLYTRLFPTLVLNAVFIVLMYSPMRKLFRAIEAANLQESD